MIHPAIDEFRALAKPGALVPVYRDIVADLETPVTAYMKIARNEKYSFLLESVERADTISRYSFLGEVTKSDTMAADYAIKDLRTGELLDGSPPSGYDIQLTIFQQLCPGLAK